MTIWFSSIRRSRTIRMVQAFAIGTIAVLAASCSEQGAATQSGDAPFTVTTSQMFVSVQNNAGLPVTDVTVGIVPMGPSGEFTKFFGRIENSEKRDIALGEFNGRDGTPFSLRIVKPKAVHIKGTDVNGKTYDFELPWQ